MTLSVPESLLRRPEEMRRYRCRTKVCNSYNMARKSVNYDKYTEELRRIPGTPGLAVHLFLVVRAAKPCLFCKRMTFYHIYVFVDTRVLCLVFTEDGLYWGLISNLPSF